MATLEKPKKEKTKKAKVKQKTDLSHTDELLSQHDASRAPLLEHLEKFESVTGASTTRNIVSQSCNIADTKLLEDQEDEVTGPDSPTLIEQSKPEELNTLDNALYGTEIEEATASAPPPAMTAKTPSAIEIPSPVIVQYPNLAPMQHLETKSEIVFKRPAVNMSNSPAVGGQLKPFTGEQLREIYSCAELELVKQFELEFLMNSLLETYEGDSLHAALLLYYNLQSKLSMNLHEIKIYRKKVLEAETNIWVKVPVTRTFTGRCGDNHDVRETVTYNICKVDGANLQTAASTEEQLCDLVCHTYINNLITAKVTKNKIDNIVSETMSYRHTSTLEEDSPVALQKTLDVDTLQCMTHLRRAISIVFSFIRKPSPSQDFDTDLKSWLRRLISLHLRIATKEDHWFLLFNILRCPSGVGQWAAEFLQVPCSKISINVSPNRLPNELLLLLDSAEINHCVAVLQIILLPIKKRNEYLTAFSQLPKEICDPVKEERWIVIDSDGEDEHTATGECVGLKESDLIALLNQIPFESLFTAALNIEKFLDDYIIEPDRISANQMLKVVAFFTKLIEIFGEGMLTYNTERYKQFAKRLGRLVRHSLQYVSDYNEMFLGNNLSKNPFTCERIAIELNALLIKACSYIYRTRNLATWQYFSSLPFGSLQVETVWQIFYYLNVGFPTEFPTPYENYIELFNAPDFWRKFNLANADLTTEDLYYLLQAFFEIANERDRIKDWDFINTICVHIFNIGFINEATRDVCYKTSRDMLLNLTLAYEDLMSCLLQELKIRISDTENATYLFKSLPLEIWKPSMESFETLSNWLLNFNFNSAENLLARIIISHLNWSFDCDGRLFLPHNIHVRMACLVTEALAKHAPEVIGLSSISESVRQVSSFIDVTQSTKEQFTTWCWSIVSVLRLHLMDQSVESIKRTFQNPAEPLMFVPELERIDLIYQGVTENRPLALFVAVLVSLHGHSIPLICQRGFDLMKSLLFDYRHAAVIRCLQLIVPLFLETPETLANCENFHAVLTTLLNADKTYLRMAKDMMYPNSVGPVLELFDNMIHHQIISYPDYGLPTPLNLINVWLNCLTALPNWQHTSVVYLLDKILRVAYQFPDARLQATEFFQYYYKDCDEWKGGNKISTLKTLFSSNSTRIPALSPQYGWLALVLLEIEFKTQDAQFWPELLRQLVIGNTKTNIDIVLKKITSNMKMSSFPTQMLVMYKYANLIATMDILHPLFPIMNQKFFELFLSRVPLYSIDQGCPAAFGVSDKFYENNVSLMKKIKTNLKAAEVTYSHEAEKNASEESRSYFYRNCAKIMKTYVLWLEETSINKISKDEQNFPPQFNNEKLREILNGNTSHWTEYIHLPTIRKEEKYQADQWARKCYRSRSTQHLRSPLQPKTRTTPIQRIKNHLSSYDKRRNAPKYIQTKVDLCKEIKSSTIHELQQRLKELNSTASKFYVNTTELNSLNRNYLDLIVDLYKMVPYQDIVIKACGISLLYSNCKDPARITIKQENICKNEICAQNTEKNRERHENLLDEFLEMNVENFTRNIEALGATTRVLVCAQMAQPQCSTVIKNTGISFFYAIIDKMSDITMKFQPTLDFYNQILTELGIFIQNNLENEGLTILELTLRRPDLLKVLSGVFVPYRTRPEYFIRMYKFLIDSHLKHCDTNILFVLLSKFDLITWLETFRPKLHDINQLLVLVLRGLECWSQPNSTILQDQFRRHLVHIFDHDFPEHYGEVMQMVLDRISDNKLTPAVLLDLLNSLLLRYKCEAVTLETTSEQAQKVSIEFAQRQTLFSFKATTDTLMLFARHFQKERLSHGLHGLYPKHKDYCQPLSVWFSCFGHVAVITAICTYQELLADQISDLIFGAIIEMYSPWLITYNERLLQEKSANWIRQLTQNGKLLLCPWSEQHANTSKIMITPFINTLTYVLTNLPVSHKILNHTFGWYIHHFALESIEPHIYAPIHEGVAALPWELFKPEQNYIDMLYDSLQKFIPESHAMLGHIFIRLNWNGWFAETLPTFPFNVQQHVISRLFTIFVKIAFEPNIHVHTNTSKTMEEAINYPWHMVDYAELEHLYKWYGNTAEPAVVLKLPSESNYVDRAVLDLLRLSGAMMPERPASVLSTNASAKRILYSRFYMRLLSSCAAKNQKLLATKDGDKVFRAAFIELLQSMDKTLQELASKKTFAEQNREALNMMIEIIVPMQIQNLDTSNHHVDTLIQWQQDTSAGNLLVTNTLSAIGHMNAFIASTYSLLEATIANYFRISNETKDWHSPSWAALLETLQMSVGMLDLMPIINGTHFFIMHVYILHKIDKLTNADEQITMLQDLVQLLENLKTSPLTEPRLALVWGVIISRGAKLLSTTVKANKSLLMLARYLQTVSTQSDGWGDGLLGVIGLKKDTITTKRKVLTRCLACVGFSLFPDNSSAEPQPNKEFSASLQELSTLLANKKYLDIKQLIVQAVGIITEQKVPNLRDVPHLICRLIALFYADNFLTTVPEVWDFKFALN